MTVDWYMLINTGTNVQDLSFFTSMVVSAGNLQCR